jgi:low affinity Fe/Cu permease
MQTIRELLTRLGVMAAHPGAFGILVVYAVLWFIFDLQSFDWHAGATLIVWFMTLLIQRAEHRDTQALQAKIDELLHADGLVAYISLPGVSFSASASAPEARWI